MSVDFLRGGSSRPRQQSDTEFLNMRSPAGLDTAASVLTKEAVSAFTGGTDSVTGLVIDHLAGQAIDEAFRPGR